MSRESVIWDNHTRDYIQHIIKEAQNEATALISDQLKEDDFYAWLEKANRILNRAQNRYGNQSALGEIAKIVDPSKLTAKFAPDPSIRFYQNPETFFWGMNLRDVRIHTGKWDRETGQYKKELKRTPIDGWGYFKPSRLYELTGEDRSSPVKDRYLIELHAGSYLQIKFQDKKTLLEEARKTHKDWEKDRVEKWVDKKLKIRDKIYNYLTSHDTYKINSYSDVEVPEDFEKKVEKEIEEQKVSTLSPAEKRALQGKVVCYTYEYKEQSYGRYAYRLNKEEPILGELDDIQHPVVYGNQEDDDKFKMIANLFHYQHKQFQFRPNFFPFEKLKKESYNGIAFARFSKRNTKHVKQNPNFIHVDKYLWNHTKKSYNIGSAFIPLFTSLHIKNRLRKLPYLANFRIFNEDMSKAYNLLKQYTSDCFAEATLNRVEKDFTFKAFRTKAEKLKEFQLFLDKNKDNLDEATRKQKSKEVAGHEDLESVQVIDLKIVKLLEELETYSESIKDLFNHISFLETKGNRIPDEAQRLINEILQSESLDNYQLSQQSITTLQELSGINKSNDNN